MTASPSTATRLLYAARRRLRWALPLTAAVLSACGGAQDFEPAPVVALPPSEPAGDPGPAADPLRGARLFATTPAAVQLPCAECHSSDPLVNNFGNIFAGRNAPQMIARAIAMNTGGMGTLSRYLNDADIGDIAAYLGNTPSELAYPDTPLSTASTSRAITISSSTKTGVTGLAISVQGDFVRTGGTCGDAIARFASCAVEIAFRPGVIGASTGSITVSHADAPLPIRINLRGTGIAHTAALTRALVAWRPGAARA